MLSLPRRAFRVAVRLKLEYLAPIAVGLAFILAQSYFVADDHDGPRRAQPVVVVGTTPVALFAPTPMSPPPPVRIVQLDVAPRVITIGQPASLLNGICNDTSSTVNVQLYLGAQLDGDPLTAPVVDLVGKDTPEGRVRRNLEPGCLGDEPITAEVDNRLTPGKWRLHLVVMVTGDSTPIVRSSPIFEVRPAK